MVAIKHHTLWDGFTESLAGITYNEGHDAGTIADVLTDHNKAAHDALGIDAATLGGNVPGSFMIDSFHGTATITAENSYIDVVHNLGSTPTSYAITPLSAEGAIWFLSGEGINSFRINLLSSQFADASFKWRIFE